MDVENLLAKATEPVVTRPVRGRRGGVWKD
jgi:hypothetical protein